MMRRMDDLLRDSPRSISEIARARLAIPGYEIRA